MSRDWMADFYSASWRGVGFWVKRDSMDTGRRLNVTEIPNSDVPFIEDLGAKHRNIEINGYFLSDVSDAEIISLENAIQQGGAGVLVMPAQGPLTARGENIKRDRQRDEMGRIGFEAKFILDPRSGFATPTPAYPADYLAQLAFDANDNMGAAMQAMLSGFQV
jgi:prophage DNA circulation protein